MDYNSINLRKVKKEDLIKSLLQGNFTVPSIKEKKKIQKTIALSVEQGNYLIARNTLILGICFDTENTFLNIRRKGFFRYTNYISKKCIVHNLASELLEICNLLGHNSLIDIKYLKSVINLSNLHKSYNEIQQFILEEINLFTKKYEGKSLIKSLLSYVDYLFLSNHYPESITNPSEISSRSKEDICSAVSYLIYFISEKKPLSIADAAFVSEKYIKSGEIGRIIIAACFISDFKGFEILIDHFNYECISVEENLQIKPPIDDFEKSIRLGYIRSQLQGINDRPDVEEATSIEELVEEMNKYEEFNFFQLTETHNYPRYRVEIPEPIYEFIVNRFFKPDLLFKEEITYLSHIFKEQLLNHEDLKNLKIKDGLNLMEFIKIKRVFYLFYLLFTKHIYKKEKTDTDLLLRSLIPVYPEEMFYSFIEKLTPIDNIDSFLDLVCWEPKMDILFDLQYHPIIFLNDHFLIPLTILIHSNSIRNLFASEYKKDNKNLFTDGSIDALVEKLHKSFNSAKIQSYKQTPIPNTDIDLFAIYENTLFLFECKQSLHPVSIFDLRTTYDYVKKAEKQLDYLNQEFSNGNLIKALESKHGIDLNGVTQVVSCIVLSNRLFNGNVFKYPIRNINEIENILEIGTMRTNEGEFWLWKDNELCLADLLEYFSLENKFVKLLYDSLSVRTLKYELADPNIEFKSYYMDSEKAMSMLNEFTSTLRKVK